MLSNLKNYMNSCSNTPLRRGGMGMFMDIIVEFFINALCGEFQKLQEKDPNRPAQRKESS